MAERNMAIRLNNTSNNGIISSNEGADMNMRLVLLQILRKTIAETSAAESL